MRMTGSISFILLAIASMIAITESRVIPAKSSSVMMDSNSSPIIFLREKRTVVRPYPHKAMMFTGYYRPIRRPGNGSHATGLFAQGNAVSGGTFFGGMHAPYHKNGPEPIEELEVSSAQAQAAPASDEDLHHHYHHQNEVHRQEEEQYHKHHEEEKYHHYHQDSSTSQEHYEPEQIPLTTEIAQSAEVPIAPNTEVSVTRPPKGHHPKKTHKTPVTDDDDEEEDEDDEDDDQPIVPFVPFKGNRRHQRFPHLNNFFPMIFSFPRVATRRGSSGSIPGTITAIANSYSTGKGGVASSVATAYGGSPIGKKRRPQPYEE